MNSIRSSGDLDRITVKIHNMKRSASRDSPRVKRRNSASLRYDGSSDDGRMSPDRHTRSRLVRSPSPRPRYVSPHPEEYPRPTSERPVYKVLCVSSIHLKASDEFIKETLYREYKKFGDFSIRVSHEVDERVAYICFRTPEDAREAKHHKPRIMFYDKMAVVEAVYEGPPRADHRSRHKSSSPPPPEYDRHYYIRSPAAPVSVERHRLPPHIEPHHPYERAYGPPAVPMHHPPEFRPIHHEYIPRGPPIRHLPPHMHPAPHRPYIPRHIIPRPHIPHYEKPDKKDKFPNYLHHVQPEDDPLATRTLFAGNLEINISDEELRRIFGKYGIVEDIDIKRPPPGTGNAFAFVRYQNLDMAHRAKVELSGQYIGKFQCKIGYGKATPTSKIWIGGLGAWTSVTQLEREFDRFGAIKKIEYQKGDTSAYILYESVEAATSAVKEMRGFALGGPEKRLRIDFADGGVEGAPAPAPFRPKAGHDPVHSTTEYRRPEYEVEPVHYQEIPYHVPYHPRGGYRGRGMYRGRGVYRGAVYHHDIHRMPVTTIVNETWNHTVDPADYEKSRSLSRQPPIERSRSRSPHRNMSPESDTNSRTNGILSSVRNLQDVSRKCSIAWQGALILKSSLFPAKFYLTDGDSTIINSLMKDEEGKHHLRITQRLRLDQTKLDDVRKRISSSSSHAIFLGLASSGSIIQLDDAGIQTRPLRNLVSYLKQKEAAGVISLLNKETEATGVLYAFPPCDFSTELLKRSCHSMSDEGLKEDFLLIVVVHGGTA
ncbi:RNA-binding protein spenito [Condylostylus longicornis]|uniref:RNA-binding protein spenito n=1 Tax=Condylostylus longicornis TaxID=2530218 RepID=UPI00244DFCD4|nr:RNA-binding protein spenito [Condylostylus longicornis]XP_055374070.1 RNA-binding protein spenito [Condylostylus longicornis]